MSDARSRATTEPRVVAREVTHAYRRRGRTRIALSEVSLELHAGRTLAIIGESGAGKSTLARLICGLEQPTAGAIRVAGATPRARAGRVGAAQMVFQDPAESVDPFLAIGRSIGEPLHRLPRQARRARVHEVMSAVGVDPARSTERPSKFSGGQLQRIGIARALASEPGVLVCDEPTSALDVSVQAQIVNLLLRLQGELGFACILITHDLAVARILAHDLLLLRDGRTVEYASAEEFFSGPASTYGAALLDAARGEPGQHARSGPTVSPR